MYLAQPALRRRAPALLAGGLIAAVALTLLTLRLLSPPARSVDIGGPGDAYAALSLYPAEAAWGVSFRWSGPNSALELPDHVAGGALLRLRAHGAYAGQRLTFDGGGADPAPTVALGAEWRVYQLLVAAPRPPHRVALRAALVTPGSDDPRELGIALDWVRWVPAPRGLDALPAALGAAALLVWAAALVGAATLLVWPGAPRPEAPHGFAPSAPWAALALGGAAAAALTVWAWRDLDGLRWLLPLEAGTLTLASLAVGAVWALPPAAERVGQWWAAGPGRAIGARAAGAAGTALVLGLAHAALWAPLPSAWRGAAALVILWAPGWLAARLLLRHERDRAMGLVLSVAGAVALQVCIALAATLLPGGATGANLLALSNLASATALALGWRRVVVDEHTPPAGQPRRRAWEVRLALLALLVAAALRLPALGAAELHDDEASVLLAAAELAQGGSEVLLRQLKGPAQIVLPAGVLALTGQLSELTARLPFALAGLAVVAGAAGLARAPLGAGGAAGLAGLALALDGLLIAFARIVQYQSVVMLMGVAAFWCAWRFAQGGPGGGRHLAAAAICVAVALLGHYDAIYVLPALLVLVAAGARRRGWGVAATARALTPPALLGGGLVAAFYVPFVLHPHFAETIGHVQERTGQTGAGWTAYNNLGASYELLTVYNTPAQIGALGLGLAVAVVAVLAAGARRGEPGRAAARLATVAWLAAAGGAMSFLIAQPRTHIYVAVIPAALLAAVGARAIGGFGRPARWTLASAGLMVAVGAGLHQHAVFLRQSPEHIRNYPAAQLAPLPGGATLALDPAARFGFPGRDGWKAVGELYRRGELRGAAASNQSSEVLAWYLRGQRRCGAEPMVHLVALTAPNASIPPNLVRTGTVQVAGRDQILIYERAPAARPPRVIALEDYAVTFDERAIPPMPPSDAPCGPRDAALGGAEPARGALATP